MKIAISANGQNLDATVNERFGRCPYFLIVETDDMSCEAIPNTNAELSSGAGIQAASMVASKGAKAVITGSCGPKAMQVFSETGIQTILNQQGVVRDVVEAFKGGTLSASDRANAPSKAGFTAGAGAGQAAMGMGGGRGLGGGRGMGMGGGRGMGRRCGGYGTGFSGGGQTSGALSREQELAELKRQADACKDQLAAIEDRIKQLS